MTRGKGAPLVIRFRRGADGEYQIARGPAKAKVHRNKIRRKHLVSVDRIRFAGAVDIHYARIPRQGPNGHPSYIATGNEMPRHHFDPAAVRPIAGSPHWVNSDTRPVSWPAAYVRGGAAGGPHARSLSVDFTATGNLNGLREIRAVCPGLMTTDIVQVQFVGGVALGVQFQLQNVPATVRCCSDMTLRWQSRTVGAARFTPSGSSRHTLYFLDAAPRAAVGQGERHYFEVIDWACRWADGQAGPANVLQQILQRFQPVAAVHASGLIYWRNHQAAVNPAQNVATAIRYQDFGIGERKASSCIVFDRVFMNCLAIHGIRAMEIMLAPSPLPFMRNTTFFLAPTRWNAATVAAHGNPGAPDGWQNHWVTAVDIGGGWQLYDPSYGVGPHALAGVPNPLAANQLVAIPPPYEASAVLDFPCTAVFENGVALLPPRVDRVPSASPNFPCLIGQILAFN